MTHIRLLTAADIPLGMRLKQQAGWNQTEQDWARFLGLEPEGCFVAEWEGAAVGTTATCTFGPVAWVAMVLVDAGYRGRGIGKALMAHALAFLDRRGVQSVRLDATPLGQPIYEKLGFRAEYPLARYEGTLPASPPQPPPAALEEPERVEELIERDRAATGTDRGRFLRRLHAERPGAVRVVRRAGRVEGFLMARPGAHAWQLGPCIASAAAGPLLVADALARYAGERVFLDIPLENAEPARLAAGRGLTVQRYLLRMCRGPRVAEEVASLWASSGPELG
jgi:predicted N-acetyltransferase YhbS